VDEKLAEIYILEDDNLRAPINSVALSVTWTLPPYLVCDLTIMCIVAHAPPAQNKRL
jgi:hypothetical protein